jgi:hypothetical protein
MISDKEFLDIILSVKSELIDNQKYDIYVSVRDIERNFNGNEKYTVDSALSSIIAVFDSYGYTPGKGLVMKLIRDVKLSKILGKQ